MIAQFVIVFYFIVCVGIMGVTGEEDNSLAEYGLQVLNEVL